jgi:S1-C subfamily serine protease
VSTRRPRSALTHPPIYSNKGNNSHSKNSNWIYGIGALICLAIASFSLWGSNLNTKSVADKSSDYEPAKRVLAALSPTVFTVFNNGNRSQGSGVFIANNGIGVTNDHVVKNSALVMIRTSTGKEYTAKVIIKDQMRDLAIIDIGTNVSCTPISSIPTEKGETVYALGTPLGMEQTFTNGIISGKMDEFSIYHTAAIAPGSSGSALVNSQGQLVGINKALLTTFRAISIATPIQELLAVYPKFDCK